LAAAEKIPRYFFIAFLNSPCYETPENVINKSGKTTEARKKENGGGKPPHLFVMSPDVFF
jgi:hypothetical protein